MGFVWLIAAGVVIMTVSLAAVACYINRRKKANKSANAAVVGGMGFNGSDVQYSVPSVDVMYSAASMGSVASVGSVASSIYEMESSRGGRGVRFNY